MQTLRGHVWSRRLGATGGVLHGGGWGGSPLLLSSALEESLDPSEATEGTDSMVSGSVSFSRRCTTLLRSVYVVTGAVASPAAGSAGPGLPGTRPGRPPDSMARLAAEPPRHARGESVRGRRGADRVYPALTGTCLLTPADIS